MIDFRRKMQTYGGYAERRQILDDTIYNYVLKCFVLIDLKLDKLTHQDIGQMDFYIRYYDNEIKA